MKIALMLLVRLLLVVTAVPAIAVFSWWRDAAAVVAEAERSGLLPTQDAARQLNVSERTIVISQYGKTWNVRRWPCRPVAAVLDLMFSDEIARPTNSAVSGRLAQRIVLSVEGPHPQKWQVKVLLAACALERRFSDTEMLRMDLADAYFGDGLRGLDKAATAIFGRAAAELDLTQSAQLAALLRYPSNRRHPDRWRAMTESIVKRVAEHPFSR